MPKSRLDASHLDRYVQGLRPEFERNLKRLVEIPTVSMDPDRSEEMRFGAERIAGCFYVQADDHYGADAVH